MRVHVLMHKILQGLEKQFCRYDVVRKNLSKITNNLRIADSNNVAKEFLEFSEDRDVTDISRLLFRVANNLHPSVNSWKSEEDFQIIKTVGEKKSGGTEHDFSTILEGKDLLRTKCLMEFCGHRSYFFVKTLAELEHALVEFTVLQLLKNGFVLVSVPDILWSFVLDGCGMASRGQRTQVYTLGTTQYGFNWCLSGTSEMALATLLSNKDVLSNSLPLKLAAVSRCYRAEVSRTAAEKSIYRVHQFTKVEMFCACSPGDGEAMLEELCSLQEKQLQLLDLHYRLIEIGPDDLGRQAYHKYDIECWMPGSYKYGEITSASNCTDYQSSRLNIKSGNVLLHTVNGTACAVPRLLIGLVEKEQFENLTVPVPKALQPYIDTAVMGAKRGPKLHYTRLVPKSVSRFYLT